MYNNSTHFLHMRKALDLARRAGIRETSPNPRVGAVIVKDGRIIGEGYHHGPGTPHAEAAAITDAQTRFPQQLPGAALYVTLEPCCHSGPGKRTPPCTDAVLRSGIASVCAAGPDPNPQVAGRGFELLRARGLKVASGILEQEAEELNRWYFHAMRTGRPWVILKAAQSLDGFIADRGGKSKWISCPESREEVHRLRAEVDAVIVGRGTFNADDPLLTSRVGLLQDSGARQPVPVILGSPSKMKAENRLLRNPPSGMIIACPEDALNAAGAFESRGIKILGFTDLDELLRSIRTMGINSVLVEGGNSVFSSFIEKGLADEMILYIAPVLFGSGVPGVSGFRGAGGKEYKGFLSADWTRLGADIRFRGIFNGGPECLPA